VIGLIEGGDETAYRDEVQKITSWSSGNNQKVDLFPLNIDEDCVEIVQHF